MYPGFLAIVLVTLVYLITNELKIGKKASIVAALLVVSIFWPNNLHFSRQSLALISYLMSLFLLFRLIFHGVDRRVFALLGLQIFFMVISHPATPLFFMFNLVAIVALGWVTQKIGSKERWLITHTMVILIIFWLLWNMIGTRPGIIYTLKDIMLRVAGSLQENPAEASGVERIFVGYTPDYSSIINIRFSLTLLIFLSSFLIPLFALVIHKSFKNWKLLAILTGLAWSNMSIAVPLLYAGLPYYSKPALFTFISWAPLGALAYKAFTTERKRVISFKMKKIAKFFFLLAFVILPALILPIVKYAPLPYLYPTSVELANKNFWDLHWKGENLLYLEYYHLIYYSYILSGVDEPLPSREWLSLDSVYRSGEGLNFSSISTSSIWVTYRLYIRDAFYAYEPSMLQVVEKVTKTLPENAHNKVYDAGWPDWILIPRSNGSISSSD